MHLLSGFEQAGMVIVCSYTLSAGGNCTRSANDRLRKKEMYLLSERRPPNAERRTPSAERRTPSAG
jgi:hypothetical protein